MTGTVGGVQDLIVEDREVEGEAKTDRVGWSELSLGNIGGVLEREVLVGTITRLARLYTYFVGLVGCCGCNFALFSRCKLSKIAVVVSLPAKRTTN